MQIIMSPAKLMNFDSQSEKIKTTQPVFNEKTAELLRLCQTLSTAEIAEKMKVNVAIARDVHSYFQSYELKSTPRRAAALAYNGIAYKGLNAHDFDPEDFAFAQKRLNILSGFYGVLKPLDEIKPYQLEFARKIRPKGYKNLYDFWQNEINESLANKLRTGEKTIINVASEEYSKNLNIKLLPQGTKIINIHFLQYINGELKQIVVHSKKARGLMARFIIKNKIVQSQEVMAFDYEDYFFEPKLSDSNNWFFTR